MLSFLDVINPLGHPSQYMYRHRLLDLVHRCLWHGRCALLRGRHRLSAVHRCVALLPFLLSLFYPSFAPSLRILVLTTMIFVNVVGIGEAMFGQAVTFHYSLWYKKDELSKRLALFIGAGTLSGAFGGRKYPHPLVLPFVY